MFLAMGDNSQLKQVTGQELSQYLSDPQQLNSYSYASNNPIIKSDPSGNCPFCIVGVGMLAMYAPQIINYAQSLATPIGQFGINQATQDFKQGNYGWAVFGFATAGEIPVRNASNLSKIENLSLSQHAIEKSSELKQVFGKSLNQVLTESSKLGEAFVDYGKNNVGNINIYVQSTEKLVTRVTTNPEVTKVISVGINKIKDLAKWTDSGRIVPLQQSGSVLDTIKSIIKK